MLRPLHSIIISFCALLTASNCNQGCETNNGFDTERIIRLENNFRHILQENQEVRKLLDEINAQKEAIFQAKEEIDQLMALKAELEQKLAELQALRNSEAELEELKRQLQETREDIINKSKEISQLEKDLQAAQQTANLAILSLEELKRQLQELKEDVANKNRNVQTQLQDLENKLPQYALNKDLVLLEQRVQALEAQIKKGVNSDQLKQALADLKKDMTNAQQQVENQLKDELSKQEKKLRDVEAKLVNIVTTAQLQNLQQELATKGSSEDLKKLQDELNKLKASNTTPKSSGLPTDVQQKLDLLMDNLKKQQEAEKQIKGGKSVFEAYIETLNNLLVIDKAIKSLKLQLGTTNPSGFETRIKKLESKAGI